MSALAPTHGSSLVAVEGAAARTTCGWKPVDVNQDADRNRLFDMVERGVPVARRVLSLRNVRVNGKVLTSSAPA